MFASLRNLLCLCLLLPSLANAQYQPQSPANVAYLLFRTCVEAEFQTNDNIFSSKTEQQQFMEYLDDKCITWTVAWFPAFVGYPIDKMSSDRLNQFISMRQLLLNDVVKQALVVAFKKK